MSLREKYFKKEGYTAFRLWTFAIAIEELSQKKNKAKVASLKEQVIEFYDSAWMSVRGTAEEKADLQKIIDEITVLEID